MTAADSAIRAKLSVTAIFMVHSAMFSSWLVRVPHVKNDLRLSDADFGTAMLAAPLGAVLATALSLCVLPRWGSHRLVPASVAGYAAAGAVLGSARSELWLFSALAVLGFFQGALDVGMNTQAATVERLVAAPIMPRFHGMRSVGVLLGALIGAMCAKTGIGLAAQMTVTGLVVLLVIEPLTRYLIRQPAAKSAKTDKAQRLRMTPTLAVLAAVSFASFLCEGTAAGWSADYLRVVVHAGPVASALGYAAFTAAMAATRLSAVPLYRRVSIHRLLPAFALFAATAVCVMLFIGNLTTSLIAFAALGIGVALLVPAAMTSAYPAGGSGSAIAIVAAAGWAGSLAGPPSIGHLAEFFGLSAALIVVPIAITLVAIAVRCTHAFDAADRFRQENVEVQ